MKNPYLIFTAGFLLGAACLFIAIFITVRARTHPDHMIGTGALTEAMVARINSKTADQIAREVIHQHTSTALYNGTGTREDYIKGAMINSPARLDWLLNEKNTTEELRICLALYLINNSWDQIRWTVDRYVLADRFIEISKQTQISRQSKQP